MGTETKKDITRLAFAIVLISGLGISGAFLQGLQTAENVAAVETAVETTQWTNPDARRGGQNIPFGSGTSTRTVEVESFEKETRTNNPVAVDLLAKSLQSCDVGGEGGCKNLCSTSYIVPIVGGYETQDCYASPNDPFSPDTAVLALQQCIEKETGYDVPKDTDPVKEALCIGDVPKLLLDSCEGSGCNPEGAIFGGTERKDGRLLVPAACRAQLDEVRKLRNPGTVKPSATQGDGVLCVNKGPAVCYPKDFNDWSKGYNCIIKDPKLRAEVSGISGTPSTSRSQCNGTFTQRMQCEIKEVATRTSSAWTSVGVAIGQGIGAAFTRWDNSSNRSSRGSSSSQGCSAGYVKAVVDGRTVCKKEGTVTPQCLIDASKKEILSGETVVIRWRTASAETVSISGIGTDLPKSSETKIRPSETTTYELIAKGDGDNNEKMCQVTVVVEGSNALGPTGSSPPQLSCIPNTIRIDKPSTIKWACTTAAETSEGIGIDTEGKVSGEVTVTPTHNEEYAVKCLDEDDIEIGRNTCAVNVGEPLYDIVVEPEEAERGDRVRVAWSSLFMRSCKVSGPRGFNYTNPQGVVITEPFSFDKESVPDRQIRAAVYTLECESEFGTQATKDVTVEFKPED